MNFLMFLSEAMIPILVFYIVATGLWNKQNIYDDFVRGAFKGLKTVVSIAPTLVGLMVAVGILRASGFLDFLTGIFARLIPTEIFPADLIPLTLVKMFSSSAATGLLLDLYKTHGTDSLTGLIASIMLCSTETIFYTMSIYFMSVKVTKTRWTLAGALFATLAGIVASVVLAGRM